MRCILVPVQCFVDWSARVAVGCFRCCSLFISLNGLFNVDDDWYPVGNAIDVMTLWLPHSSDDPVTRWI